MGQNFYLRTRNITDVFITLDEKKGRRKDQRVPQSQTAAFPRHQEVNKNHEVNNSKE